MRKPVGGVGYLWLYFHVQSLVFRYLGSELLCVYLGYFSGKPIVSLGREGGGEGEKERRRGGGRKGREKIIMRRDKLTFTM